ncbi:interferon-induced protein 44-like [Mercenaria mercenaria]|uniref:interferon-induced protein 44-like n=1 Tax=Mercenaria mercenaria TaxID=6596 RepID=UPI00234F88F6|nr:interferon-induced protein 44-like [Mercenaria mercenaria]
MVVVATKIDKQCENITEDADHLYKCIKSHDAVRRISKDLDIQENHVLPVVNYTTDEKKSNGKDRLALGALYTMVDLAKKYLEKHTDMVKKVDEFEERGHLLSSRRSEVETKVKEMTEEMASFDSETLLILCIGPNESGKTSFIDSIYSTLMREICQITREFGAYGGKSGDFLNTEMFHMYKIGDQRSNVYFGDMAGMEKAVCTLKEYIQCFLEGNSQNIFSLPDAVKSSQSTDKPGRRAKILCACIVVHCQFVDKFNGLPGKLKETMHPLQQFLSIKGIPYVVILTKGDEQSENAKLDKIQVYESKKVKRCVKTLVTELGLKQNFIFPVVNYTHENNVDATGDIILLDALEGILKRGRNFLEGTRNRESNSNKDYKSDL